MQPWVGTGAVALAAASVSACMYEAVSANPVSGTPAFTSCTMPSTVPLGLSSGPPESPAWSARIS